GRFESRPNFGTWLYRITANCSVHLMRAGQGRHDQVRAQPLKTAAGASPNDMPDPERLAERGEIKSRVQSALDLLSPLERNLIENVHSPSRLNAADLDQM